MTDKLQKTLIAIVIVFMSIMGCKSINNGSVSQTTVAEPASPYVGKRPEYQMLAVGLIQTQTKDTPSYSVSINVVIGFNMNDKNAQAELTEKLSELQVFIRMFFSSKYAVELQPENEARIKQEILEILNARYLDTSHARIILFEQLQVTLDE